MKRLIQISAFLLLLGIYACEPPVTFNLPQPTGVDNLSKFPKRLQGKYVNPADNSTLIINDKIIQRIYDYDYKFHMNELDSVEDIAGDTLIDLKTNEKIKVRKDGDSLITHIHNIDTIFLMKDDQIVRKFKGYYFLSKRYDTDRWEVKKIQLAKGQLFLSSISTKADIEILKAITEAPEDTVSLYKFTATKKQFKKFIKSDGFSDEEVFVRMKKN